MNGITNSCGGAGGWDKAGLGRSLGKDRGCGAPRGGDSGKASELLAVAAMRRIGAEISITTDEGDTVTLSLQSELDASFAVYRRPASRESSGLRAASLSVSRSSDIEITVDGDLNEQERADVQKLVQQLSRVIRDFLAGRFDASVVGSFDDVASNSLAGYSLHVERTESLAYLRDRGVPSDSRAATDPSIAPAATGPGAAGPTVVRDPGSSGRRELDLDHLLRQMRKAIRESGVDLGRVGRHLEKTMRRLLDRIGQDPRIEPARPELNEIAARWSDAVGGDAPQDAVVPLLAPEPAG